MKTEDYIELQELLAIGSKKRSNKKIISKMWIFIQSLEKDLEVHKSISSSNSLELQEVMTRCNFLIHDVEMYKKQVEQFLQGSK